MIMALKCQKKSDPTKTLISLQSTKIQSNFFIYSSSNTLLYPFKNCQLPANYRKKELFCDSEKVCQNFKIFVKSLFQTSPFSPA